ncbi:MAG TPA: hypothetical protein VIM58_09955, partial [Candidatus Methylacidiphilales bacterium]
MSLLRTAFLALLAGGGLSTGAAALLIAGSPAFPSCAGTARLLLLLGLGLLFVVAAAPLFRAGRDSDSLSR